jgi:Holliday junction resolvase
MSCKKKVKINGEEVDVVVVEAPVKNKAELQKIEENLKGISEFAEKLGGRYEIRMKIGKTFSNYLTEVNIPLPFPSEKEFHLNLMKIISYFFFISIIIL